MEKRVMGIFRCPYAALITLAFGALTANAQLIVNPSFETPAISNYVFAPDNNGVIVTNSGALGWSFSELTARSGTNCPCPSFGNPMDTYEDPNGINYDYYGINNTGTNITVHSGAFSLRAFGPTDTNFCCTASYAYQTITDGLSQPVTNGQIWVASGYAFVWSGDPMTNFASSVGFGNLQLAFLGTNGVSITSFDAPHVLARSETNPAPLDTWISVTVTGTAPYSSKTRIAEVRVYAGHVGEGGALGSVFWDDITLTNTGVAPPPPPIPTNQFQAVIQTGNQICWGTIANASYQPQSSDDNASWSNIGAQMPGDGTTNCAFGVTHKFYRVLRLQ